MPTRDDLLQELGLAPTWCLRGRSGIALPEPAPTSVAPAEPVPTTPRSPSSYRVAEPLATDPGSPPLEVDTDGRRARIAALTWTDFADDVAACTACGLCRTRKLPVPGVGDERAEWLFVGEAPGAEEDARGEPFVGQAGKLLDSMVAALGMRRGANVYIANVLKCRPPNNRTPEPREVAACRPYLDRQIALIRPRLVVALGKSAATTLLGVDATIASLRGRVHRYQGVPLVVTYHPAYLLRNLPDKAKAWEDLLLARRTAAAPAAPTTGGDAAGGS